MNGLGSSLAKLMALATGAMLGVLLSRWYEQARSARVEQQFQRDKAHYSRGLSPVERQRENQSE